MEYTASSIQCFLDCRQKYKYSYIDLIAPKKPSWALIAGSAFHLGMELKNKKVPERKIISQIMKYYDDIEENYTEDYELEDFELNKQHAIAMSLGYLICVKPDFQEIMPERVLRIKWKGYDLAMKVDGIARKDRKNWLKEYKTTGQADLDRYKAGLEMNIQVDYYVHNVNLAFKAKKKKAKLEGVLYEIVRKPLLKQRRNEEFEEYVQRIRKDYLKRPPFYFHRKYVYRSPQEVKDFSVDLEKILADMTYCIEHDKYYKNKSNCTKYGQCQFYKLCFHSDPEVKEGIKQDMYRKKTSTHEELEDEK